ncbi:hypothetical protein [Bradyrhizobium viridifuturi]|uniref:hypothetical protein n=1 Tax=Bradyrhizobium viridifuturi TaxID=1654716 RepID=UPI00067F057B|nr:hypothetical protein [Bradyrhizobium viridifuturi]
MNSVVDITAIAPSKIAVPVGDDALVEVRGLSMHRVADFIAKYPTLLTFLDKSGSVPDPIAILNSIPDAAIEIMAAGVGKDGDSEIASAIGGWELPQQTDLLTGVLSRTFSGTAGPFVQALLAAAARGAKGAASQQHSPSAPEGSASISQESPSS